MSDGHNVRTQLLDTTKDTNTISEAKELAKDITAGGFTRGKLLFQDDCVIFAPALNDSKILDAVDNYLGKGPISPVRLLGLYNPYETSLQDAARYEGYREFTYASITGISFIAKGKTVEITVESTELPADKMLRVRIDSGIWLWPVYNGNKRAGTKIAHKLLKRADAHGGVEIFNASGLYSGPTKAIELDYEPEHNVEYPADRGTASATAETNPNTGSTSGPGQQKHPTDAHRDAERAEKGEPSWLEDTTRTLTIQNTRSDPVAPTVGVRTGDNTVFTESLTIEPSDNVELDELPNTPFEVGTKLDGTVFSIRFDEHDDPKTVTVTISSSGINVSKTRAQRQPETEEKMPRDTDPTPEETATNRSPKQSTQETSSTTTRSSRKKSSKKPPGESTETEPSLRGGKKLIAAGALAVLLAPILIVSLQPPQMVKSGLWGLSVLLILWGGARFLFRK